MELIIKLPSWVYESVKNGTFDAKRSPYDLEYVLKYGYPLPAKHGDLIDADVLLNDLAKLCYDKSSLADNPYIENPHIDSIVDVVETEPAIIPADNTIICPNCGIEQYNDKEYCMDCGARLDGGE